MADFKKVACWLRTGGTKQSLIRNFLVTEGRRSQFSQFFKHHNATPVWG